MREREREREREEKESEVGVYDVLIVVDGECFF
jgi:hypothetical protein